MRKLVALVVGVAFSLGIGLAVPQTFAQTPAPKEEKSDKMGKDKKGAKKTTAKEKKADKNKDKMEKKEEKK